MQKKSINKIRSFFNKAAFCFVASLTPIAAKAEADIINTNLSHVDNMGRVVAYYAVCPVEPISYLLESPKFVEEQQKKLDILGFDLGHQGIDGSKGRNTKHALRSFRLFYLHEDCVDFKYEFNPVNERFDDKIVDLIDKYSKLAVIDAEEYGINTQIAAALRLASIRTGVSFEFLAETSGIESSFGKSLSAETSTAKGAFQFIESTWLIIIKNHGHKYGLDNFAKEIKINSTTGTPYVKNKASLEYILSLRNSFHLSAFMGAEYAIENAQRLKAEFPLRTITYTDTFMAHFLGRGKDGSLKFIKLLDKQPDWKASDFFEKQAKANKSVFYKTINGEFGRALSFQEVYNNYGKRFKTGAFYSESHELMVQSKFITEKADDIKGCKEDISERLNNCVERVEPNITYNVKIKPKTDIPK